MSNFIPKHEFSILHANGALASFENWAELKKIYSDVLQLHHCSHISINVFNPDNELLILSTNPNIGRHLSESGTLIYDGTVSPTHYKNMDFFWWDQTYEKEFVHHIKSNKEWRYGIAGGIVLVNRINNYYVNYSFGFKSLDYDIKADIENNKANFLNMGDYCFNHVKHIAERYLEDSLQVKNPKPL